VVAGCLKLGIRMVEDQRHISERRQRRGDDFLP
jgi:hypothetical protein